MLWGQLHTFAEEPVSLIDPDRFAVQVHQAAKAAFTALIGENPGQTFYAFGLFTNDSLGFLHPAANTEEALAATVRLYRETVDPKYGCTSTRAGMRWSYGDWGFFPYEQGDHFGEVNRVLWANTDRGAAAEWSAGEPGSLWAATLNGLLRLDAEAFFGSGPARARITVLVVGDLPAELVNAWATALNPPDVAERFRNWDCDAPDDGGE